MVEEARWVVITHNIRTSRKKWNDIFKRAVGDKADFVCLQEMRLDYYQMETFRKRALGWGFNVAFSHLQHCKSRGNHAVVLNGCATLYRHGLEIRDKHIDKQRTVVIQAQCKHRAPLTICNVHCDSKSYRRHPLSAL